MSLPKSVQDIGDAAEALRVRLFETTATPVPPPPEPPAPVAPPASAPTPPAPAPTPVSAPPVAPAEQNLEHRFSVLQGKYNAEVPVLHKQVRDLNASNQDKDREIARLREQLKANTRPLVSQEEIEQHGEGQIDLMRRLVQEQTAPLTAENASLKAELESLRGGVQKARATDFWGDLAKAVPDWAVVNADAVHFHPFLDQYNPLAGKTYQELLEDAQTRGDARQAAEVFTAFKRERDSKAANANTALEGLAVPAQGSAPPTPADPTKKRMISQQEIKAHYTKLRRGEYPSLEAANAAEAEIQLAVQEGRIQ